MLKWLMQKKIMPIIESDLADARSALATIRLK
jgi:hypothetical protein